jgi:hypothetical protein
MRVFIAMELGVSVENVSAFVLGGHGDTMVPLPRYSTVAEIPITELLPQNKIDAIMKRTADKNAEIVALLKTGSAYYAPASSTMEIMDAILKDKHKNLPCSCYLENEYGIRDLYVGVPAQLGQKGVERVWEIKLTDAEAAALRSPPPRSKELVDDEALAIEGSQGAASRVPGAKSPGSNSSVSPFTRESASPRRLRLAGVRWRAVPPPPGPSTQTSALVPRIPATTTSMASTAAAPTPRTSKARHSVAPRIHTKRRRTATLATAARIRSSVPPNGPHEILKRPIAYVAR